MLIPLEFDLPLMNLLKDGWSTVLLFNSRKVNATTSIDILTNKNKIRTPHV
ncbi:hypothetical protein MTR_4g088705 [Medicago truncatula]|uniref:Uncharacterized protein n=1 Tax=Medicago truncatula TaxID=3880 RepID=A0A072UYW4_MEDTR|nr:hypothetical protein MTR_4g088705 [Medicago truncatula]